MLIHESPGTSRPTRFSTHRGSDSPSRPPPRTSRPPLCLCLSPLGWTFRVCELRVHAFLCNQVFSSATGLSLPIFTTGQRGEGRALGKQVVSILLEPASKDIPPSAPQILWLPVTMKTRNQSPLPAHTHIHTTKLPSLPRLPQPALLTGSRSLLPISAPCTPGGPFLLAFLTPCAPGLGTAGVQALTSPRGFCKGLPVLNHPRGRQHGRLRKFHSVLQLPCQPRFGDLGFEARERGQHPNGDLLEPTAGIPGRGCGRQGPRSDHG